LHYSQAVNSSQIAACIKKRDPVSSSKSGDSFGRLGWRHRLWGVQRIGLEEYFLF
jgi:hypothetical protein